MPARSVRTLTAIALLALCAFAMSRGWMVARYSIIKAEIAATGASTDSLLAWAAVPGVAAAAREASATRVAGPGDLPGSLKRADELSALLAVRPMSSANWLALAGMRLVTGQPPDKVLAPLVLSEITGPNENSVMIQRGVFGLLQWETLPIDARRRTISDLSGAILAGDWTDRERTMVSGTVNPKSSDSVDEISRLLRTEGVTEKELGRIGLGTKPARG
jgi:hypothetical protein